ncbi:hypothetical protein O181_008360 [Austropuccinia psidii MF-1]|uniref:Uncharacterized protein n=1 Tax=Austropuccinia psidii MF-1 TaxID=1389203 RepID=A0A9Q3BPS6_9BASI|nr:hypothetical protein [Austropuccinia psidii MF-1]
MLVRVPNASHSITDAGPGSRPFTGKSLHLSRSLLLHTQILINVILIVCHLRTGNDSHSSGGLLTCRKPQVSYGEDLKQYRPMDAENV